MPCRVHGVLARQTIERVCVWGSSFFSGDTPPPPPILKFVKPDLQIENIDDTFLFIGGESVGSVILIVQLIRPRTPPPPFPPNPTPSFRTALRRPDWETCPSNSLTRNKTMLSVITSLFGCFFSMENSKMGSIWPQKPPEINSLGALTEKNNKPKNNIQEGQMGQSDISRVSYTSFEWFLPTLFPQYTSFKFVKIIITLVKEMRSNTRNHIYVTFYCHSFRQ